MDDHSTMIRQTAERLFSAFCDRATLTDAAGGRWPGKLWAAVEEAGLTRAAVSENGGGAGAPIDDALELVRVAAEHAAPIPLGETIVSAWLLDGAGLAIPDGPLTFVSTRTQTALKVRRAGGFWEIEGRAERIPWGRNAAALVVLAEPEPGRCELLVVEPDEYDVEPGENVAGEPRDGLIVNARVPAGRAAGASMEGGDLHALGAAIRTLQIAGAMASVGAKSVAYAQDRVQFGRTLSKFQAIQQSLAVLAGQIAAAGTAADMAAAAVASGALLPAVAVAKARASEAAGLGASIAHQVHGAIGFTLEHDLQFFTKRLWSWRDEFGNETEWNTLFGRRLVATGADRMWSEITAM